MQYQNGHDYVDLGLPSGTLWATCNIGASKPEDFGNYFAWGETTGYDEGKREFDDEHYKFLKKKWGLLGSKWIYTKYCSDKEYGIVDNKRFLDDEDDAIETGALGVENRVVDDEMAGLVDRLDLLEAPEAAAHPGGENH